MSRDQWIQVNVALSREGREALASAREVFAALSARLPVWRRKRGVKLAFFTRKPPDLRLRLLAADPAASLKTELKAMFRDLRAGGAIERSFFSIYEPEAHLFGGTAAMRLVHRYFDADSAGWMALDRLAQSGEKTALPDDAISTAVLNDLIVRTIVDRFEIWDVWRNFATLTRAEKLIEAKPAVPGVTVISSLLPAVSEAETLILEGYMSANGTLGEGLRALNERGRLNAGLRAILPFVAMFHLNRYGYDQTRQAALALRMCGAWDPRAGLHGAAPQEAAPIRSR